MKGKAEIRDFVWTRMDENEVAAFPFPIKGRIPNFKGSSSAADLVTQLDFWEDIKFIKSNPDSPQRYVRKLALEQGKTVYMAVPRLKEEKCFVEIKVNQKNARKAASISGAFEYGTKIHPNNMEKIDMVVTGSVAVNNYGQRIGKGEGYSDIELGVLNHFEKIDSSTPIITTVHPLQILDQKFPQEEHDIFIDYIISPNDISKTDISFKTIPKLDFDKIADEKANNIPILRSLLNRD